MVFVENEKKLLLPSLDLVPDFADEVRRGILSAQTKGESAGKRKHGNDSREENVHELRRNAEL